LRCRNGFAMIDAMIGMMLAIFTIVSMVPLLIAVIGSADIGSQNLQAYTATRQIIENIRFCRVSTFPSGVYSAEAFGPVPQLAQMKNPSTTVQLTTLASGTRRVYVRILWRAGVRGGSTRSFEAVSLLANRGVTP
jgi:hypothetical protein